MADTDYFELAKQYGAIASRKAGEVISGIKPTVQQGISQMKQTPNNVGVVKDALRGAGVDTSGPSWYDIRAAINQGKANLVGPPVLSWETSINCFGRLTCEETSSSGTSW